jgi:t-SNARE complex subunit (syntaxin)
LKIIKVFSMVNRGAQRKAFRAKSARQIKRMRQVKISYHGETDRPGGLSYRPDMR